MYARAGIPMYWIVNLIDRQIEVHTNPDATAEEPVYRSRVVHTHDHHPIDVMVAGQVVGKLAPVAILPPA
jgi:Uma2 family endonuclease